MLKVGITGMGFMGKMHFGCYYEHPDAKIVAICDAEATRLKNTSGEAGNIAGAEKPLDLDGIELYTDFDKMLKEADLDIVSITLPTFLHKDFTVKALNAGVNVLCEKPMATTEQECLEMVAAAEKNNKKLLIGQCVRFASEYMFAKKIIDSGEYGQVISASFRRLATAPTWAWNNWITSSDSKSGGALLDLHVHDADFIQHVFGMPKKVRTFGSKGIGGVCHSLTSYIYDDNKTITAEGGWSMMSGFGFEASFNVVMEKATLVFDCTRDPAFRLCLEDGTVKTPEVSTVDGYHNEIDWLIKSIKGQAVDQIITPKQASDSIRLVLAEKDSIEQKTDIEIK